MYNSENKVSSYTANSRLSNWIFIPTLKIGDTIRTHIDFSTTKITWSVNGIQLHQEVYSNLSSGWWRFAIPLKYTESVEVKYISPTTLPCKISSCNFVRYANSQCT